MSCVVCISYGGMPAGAGLGFDNPVTYGYVVTGHVITAVTGGLHTVHDLSVVMNPNGRPDVCTAGGWWFSVGDTPLYVSVTVYTWLVRPAVVHSERKVVS